MTVILISSVLFSSCQDEVVLPKPCTDEANLPFSSIFLRIYTDVTDSRTVSIDQKGHIYCDSIIVKKNNLTKNANIAGYICEDGTFYLNAVYNDPSDKDRLKIEGQLKYNSCSGVISYCSGLYINCVYIPIGNFAASFNGSSGSGSFYTPMISGAFVANTN